MVDQVSLISVEHPVHFARRFQRLFAGATSEDTGVYACVEPISMTNHSTKLDVYSNITLFSSSPVLFLLYVSFAIVVVFLRY